jgi:pyridoxal 5'-phosphate synthase pdxT subunit
MQIGVLALQGSFAEHISVLHRLGIAAREVRLPQHLEGLDGLIIPGGESTTIGKLAVHYQLIEPLRQFAMQKAIWGTCAGAIFLSKDARRSQPLLHLMDISVERNAFGPQVASFETGLDVSALTAIDPNVRPFPGIFIRAPLIEKVRGAARVLASLPDGRIVAAQQGCWLATSFHPELTSDDRFHRYFLSLVVQVSTSLPAYDSARAAAFSNP